MGRQESRKSYPGPRKLLLLHKAWTHRCLRSNHPLEFSTPHASVEAGSSSGYRSGHLFNFSPDFSLEGLSKRTRQRLQSQGRHCFLMFLVTFNEGQLEKLRVPSTDLWRICTSLPKLLRSKHILLESVVRRLTDEGCVSDLTCRLQETRLSWKFLSRHPSPVCMWLPWPRRQVSQTEWSTSYLEWGLQV